MKSNKNNIEISEKEIHEKENLVEVALVRAKGQGPEEITEAENKPEKPKKVLTQSQLEALAKARIKAQERKQELKELNAKAKGLKEEKLKADAAEYDKLQKKKELDETVQKIEVSETPKLKQPSEPKKKIKKIIYEDDTDDESVEEVIVKRKSKAKPKPSQRSYSELADISVEEQIKKKLQDEKITCFFNQLTGKSRF